MTDERRRDYIDLDGKLTSHLAEFKAFETKVDSNWEQLTDLMEGKEVRHFDGRMERQGGLIQDVETIKQQLSNGGVRIKLPPVAWGAIWVAVIAGVFQVVSTLIQQVGG